MNLYKLSCIICFVGGEVVGSSIIAGGEVNIDAGYLYNGPGSLIHGGNKVEIETEIGINKGTISAGDRIPIWSSSEAITETTIGTQQSALLANSSTILINKLILGYYLMLLNTIIII